MDVPIPDHSVSEQAIAAFNQRMLRKLRAAIPGTPGEQEHEADCEAAQALFASLNPHDPAEAALAVLAVSTLEAALDNFARANRPGIANETVLRMRNAAMSAARSYHATLRYLRGKQPAETRIAGKTATKAAATPEPPASLAEVSKGLTVLPPRAGTIPRIEVFQPHDRFGKPIPLWRSDLMTAAQRKASLAMPRDPMLEAAAIADEERMMAEQAAADAPGPRAPDPGSG